MKFDNTTTFNFDGAFRGMRNPKESWGRSDSGYPINDTSKSYLEWDHQFMIGDKDMRLAQALIEGGPVHSKFLRQIMVSADITAPLYWWKEFDTYKVGTVANSTSTMHKIATTPITIDCFEIDDWDIKYSSNFVKEYLIPYLEKLRKKYLETDDIRYWKELIRWLPEAWLQTRTITFNYEVIRNMIKWRKNHKLSEWSVSFIEWCKSLPYSEELLFYKN